MESDPVDPAIVAFENKLDHSIRISKHIGLVLVGSGHLILEAHGCRGRMLCPQTRDVPNADGLIEGGGNDEVVPRVELGAPDVRNLFAGG